MSAADACLFDIVLYSFVPDFGSHIITLFRLVRYLQVQILQRMPQDAEQWRTVEIGRFPSR